ncbi:MAG: helix-turn-helix domain-containing protein [Butyricicoccus sp.]|nr:helix-turn-helix domain-containing protein [Butyricicoccus sp.]
MSALVDRIELLLKQKGTNFKRAEAACGLGNGTIKRWNEQSPRLDKLILVSEYLQVSLDYLVFGRSVSETSTDGDRPDLMEYKATSGLICDGSPLEDEEADLIAMFRLLPSHEREDFFDLIYFKYKKHVEKKAGSIYSTYFDGSRSEKGGPAEGRRAQDGTA